MILHRPVICWPLRGFFHSKRGLEKGERRGRHARLVQRVLRSTKSTKPDSLMEYSPLQYPILDLKPSDCSHSHLIQSAILSEHQWSKTFKRGNTFSTQTRDLQQDWVHWRTAHMTSRPQNNIRPEPQVWGKWNGRQVLDLFHRVSTSVLLVSSLVTTLNFEGAKMPNGATALASLSSVRYGCSVDSKKRKSFSV